MMSALYSGATGMKTHDAGMSTISNNIANVSTIGYKQQYTVFQDLVSQTLTPGTVGGQTTNQLGMGAQVGANRTLFTPGSFEPGTESTDIAITGKGYFQVSDGTENFYTRAGNFRFDDEGWLRTPAQMNVTGMTMVNGQVTGTATPIRIDPKDPAVAKSPPKATSSMAAMLNVPKSTENLTEDPENPMFSLLGAWDGAITKGATAEAATEVDTPLNPGMYTTKQSLKIIDAEGNSREVTLYLDGIPSTGNGTSYEYILAANPLDVTAPGSIPGQDSGLLMAGTLTFNPSGDIMNMTAFTPNGTADPENRLAQWTPATMKDGKPQFTASFAGGAPQTVTLDLGLSSSTGTWNNMPASAAEVGTDETRLGGLDTPTRGEKFSRASASTTGTSVLDYKQDGHIEGSISNTEVTADGIVRINYSNAQSVDLYTIPLYRFTSEDGLRREGGNLYSATTDSGTTEWGVPGTSNYGSLQSQQLESSNVEMSREMVSLITMQRGFQMNSKTITTADQLLQKAMEIKRN